jgi:hypothetical protein
MAIILLTTVRPTIALWISRLQNNKTGVETVLCIIKTSYGRLAYNGSKWKQPKATVLYVKDSRKAMFLGL